MRLAQYAAGIAVAACLAQGISVASSPDADQPESPSPPAPEAVEVRCEDPRPEICTREYVPVCARRDTGVRCVRAPCASTELRTYASGCTACSDPEVLAYVPGACAEAD